MNSSKSSFLHESAREHPAIRSGIITFFSGESIFTVSAMNLTPARTIISAVVSAAICDRARLSPIKSAMAWMSEV